MPVVFGELFATYESIVDGSELALASAPRYQDFIGWLLKQDQHAAFEFWRSYLAGFTATTPIPVRNSAAIVDLKSRTQDSAARYREMEISISGSLLKGLQEVAKRYRITLNQILQGVWALLLNRYENHATDTEFTDKLTEKVFIFQGINSFFSYIYIAFFKQLQANRAILQPFPGSYGCKGTCMSELNKQLQAIFISKVVLANVKEIMIPHFWWKKDRIQEQRRAELDEMAKQERCDLGVPLCRDAFTSFKRLVSISR